MTQEVLKLALEALKRATNYDPVIARAITAIKEALARPEQEPRNIRERWNIEIDGDDLLVCLNDHERSEGCHYERYVPATTAPPKRTWVGLTDEEENKYNYLGPDMHWVIQEIAAKLKEKNT